jgi:hypothetical protein
MRATCQATQSRRAGGMTGQHLRQACTRAAAEGRRSCSSLPAAARSCPPRGSTQTEWRQAAAAAEAARCARLDPYPPLPRLRRCCRCYPRRCPSCPCSPNRRLFHDRQRQPPLPLAGAAARRSLRAERPTPQRPSRAPPRTAAGSAAAAPTWRAAGAAAAPRPAAAAPRAGAAHYRPPLRPPPPPVVLRSSCAARRTACLRPCGFPRLDKGVLGGGFSACRGAPA